MTNENKIIELQKKVEILENMIEETTRNLFMKKEQIQSALTEKEILLKEIHHRVKNNLQVITSLLSLQSNFIEDEKTKGLFRYSQYRINSIALIHEMLYQSEDISKIDYENYIKIFVSGLISSMKGPENNVELIVDLPNIHLNMDTSIPLGLLINEIVTNALKYGIKDDNSGKITIALEKNKYPNFILKIGDDGEGFSEDITFQNSNSLGLMLINKLALQIKGTIKKDSSMKGTNYLISFQEIENPHNL